jgi:hypothetical protein
MACPPSGLECNAKCSFARLARFFSVVVTNGRKLTVCVTKNLSNAPNYFQKTTTN